MTAQNDAATHHASAAFHHEQAARYRHEAARHSTVIFPMPLDIVKPFPQLLEKTAKGTNGTAEVSDPRGEYPSLPVQ